MSRFGEFNEGGGGNGGGGANNPTPPGTGGATHTLTGPQLATGLVLDSTSDRFLIVSETATANGGFASVNIGPTSLSLVSVIGSAVASGQLTAISVYVPKGWFVEDGSFNATFRDAHYW